MRPSPWKAGFIGMNGKFFCEVKQAAAEVSLAKMNRDRYAQLVKEGAINQQQFEQAQTTLDTAIAALPNRLLLDMQYLKNYESPINALLLL
jgi:multidrug resistance efflux pump